MSVTVFQVVGLKKRVGIEKRFSKAISHNNQHHFCFIIVLLAVDCFAARLLHGTHKTELKESFKKKKKKTEREDRGLAQVSCRRRSEVRDCE